MLFFVFDRMRSFFSGAPGISPGYLLDIHTAILRAEPSEFCESFWRAEWIWNERSFRAWSGIRLRMRHAGRRRFQSGVGLRRDSRDSTGAETSLLTQLGPLLWKRSN